MPYDQQQQFNDFSQYYDQHYVSDDFVDGEFSGWTLVGNIPAGYNARFDSTGLVDCIGDGAHYTNAGGEPNATAPASLPVSTSVVNCYGCVLLLAPPGVFPTATAGQITTNCLRFDGTNPRTTDPITKTYTNAQMLAACAAGNAGPWNVWARANDNRVSGNLGGWFVTVTPFANGGNPNPDPQPGNPTMPRYLFSTGVYLISLPLSAPTVSRGVKGAPAAATQSLGNITDAGVDTLVDLPRTDANNFRYLSFDYGAAKAIGRVLVYNALLTGAGASLQCYVSANAIANGDFSGATPVPATITPTSAANDWEFSATGGTANGRYLYIVPAGGATACAIGDVDVRGTEYKIGALQNISMSFPFQVKDLRGSASHSLYPLDCAVYDGAVEINAESAELVESAIAQFTGAMLATVAQTKTLTPGTMRPVPFVGELQAKDSQGRRFNVITYYTFAPGFNWSMKREDYALGKFAARCRSTDATGVSLSRVWRIVAEQ